MKSGEGGALNATFHKFLVNVVGCVILGIVGICLVFPLWIPPTWHDFAIIGVVLVSAIALEMLISVAPPEVEDSDSRNTDKNLEQ
jgi:hypothetical protein